VRSLSSILEISVFLQDGGICMGHVACLWRVFYHTHGLVCFSASRCSFFCLALLCSLLYINSMRLLSAWSTYTVKHREQSFYLNMQPPTDGSDFTIGPQQTDTYNFVVFFYHTCGLVCFFVGPALRCFFFFAWCCFVHFFI
jgi:hypothetical protein